MKMNSKIVMGFGLAFALILVLVGLNYRKAPVGAVHVAIIYDRSQSPQDGCNSIRALTEKGLSLMEGRRAECKMKIFATGDKATAYEPVTIDLSHMPQKTGRVLEGKGRFLEEKDKFLNDTYSQCSAINRTEQSPVFLSVKRAVEYLKALDPKGTATLYLLVQSDLEENIEPDIKKALRASAGSGSKLPTSIDNSGINVSFCGYSETASQYKDAKGVARQATPMRNAKSADRLLEVWRSLFTHPELINFNPVCSEK
jgi:hypothetical protein